MLNAAYANSFNMPLKRTKWRGPDRHRSGPRPPENYQCNIKLLPKFSGKGPGLVLKHTPRPDSGFSQDGFGTFHGALWASAEAIEPCLCGRRLFMEERSPREVVRQNIDCDRCGKHHNADPEQRRMVNAPPVRSANRRLLGASMVIPIIQCLVSNSSRLSRTCITARNLSKVHASAQARKDRKVRAAPHAPRRA
jgi:hypothetical protein